MRWPLIMPKERAGSTLHLYADGWDGWMDSIGIHEY